MKVAPDPARKTAALAISSGRPIRPSGFCASFARGLGRRELRSQHGRVRRARGEGVDQNVRCELARPGARHREHAALGGAVDRAALAPEIGKLRSDVDDPASALPDHDPKRLAADQEDAAEIDADQPVEVRRRGLEKRLLDQDARIVDQDVEAAEAGDDGLHHSQHLAFVGHVGLHGERLAPLSCNLGDHRFGRLRRRPIRQRNLRALRRERRGDRPPDTARPAGHKSALARKCPRHVITSPRSTL